MSDKQIRARFKHLQIKTHVQTAQEFHDLNIDFRSFDNAFKQLHVAKLMQELQITHKLHNVHAPQRWCRRK